MTFELFLNLFRPFCSRDITHNEETVRFITNLDFRSGTDRISNRLHVMDGRQYSGIVVNSQLSFSRDPCTIFMARYQVNVTNDNDFEFNLDTSESKLNYNYLNFPYRLICKQTFKSLIIHTSFTSNNQKLILIYQLHNSLFFTQNR